MFEQKFRTSHIGLGSESVVAYMGDSAHKIYDAARSFITRPTQNQEDIATIHSLSLYEVRMLDTFVYPLREPFAGE